MKKYDYMRLPVSCESVASTAEYPDETITVPDNEEWYVFRVEVNQTVKPPQYFPIYRRCNCQIVTPYHTFDIALILTKAITNVVVYKDTWEPPAGSAVKMNAGKTLHLTIVEGDEGDEDHVLHFVVQFHRKILDVTGGVN